MITLTDVDGYDVLVDNSPGIIMYAAWDPKKECTYVQFINSDLYIRVQETPPQIREVMEYAEFGGTQCLDEDDPEPVAVSVVKRQVRVSGVPYPVDEDSIKDHRGEES